MTRPISECPDYLVDKATMTVRPRIQRVKLLQTRIDFKQHTERRVIIENAVGYVRSRCSDDCTYHENKYTLSCYRLWRA